MDPKEQIKIQPGHRHWNLANPQPAPRDFAKINLQHKILLAVFDSGVDYNHPELVNNTHFDLDEKGRPVSYGRDFLALDSWGHYRVVDTSLYPFADRSEETQSKILESETPSTWDEKRASERQIKECRQNAVLSIEPKASHYLDLYRDRGASLDGTYIHGTHVAGLMTYDRPDFGLISYRIIPYFRTQEQIKAENLAQIDTFQKYFTEATEHAAARGVKIVNMSLSGTIEAPAVSKTANGKRAYEEFLKRKKVLAEDMAAKAKEHPGILFVAAAGNDKGFSDFEGRVQAPCGIDAPNVLCVGALNPDGRRTQFTNLPFHNGPVVFAPGYDILSLKPSDTCPELYSFLDHLDKGSDGTQTLCKFEPTAGEFRPDGKAVDRYRNTIRELVRVCASRSNHYLRMSGTSMATPLVSRMAAQVWLENPHITRAEDLISLLIKRFALAPPPDPARARGMPPNSLSPPVPSWYKGESFFSADWDPSAAPAEVAPESKTIVIGGLPLQITPTMGRKSQ